MEDTDDCHYICEKCVDTIYNFQAFYEGCHMAQKQMNKYIDLMKAFNKPNIMKNHSESENSQKNSVCQTIIPIRTPQHFEEITPDLERGRKIISLNEVCPNYYTKSVGKLMTSRQRSMENSPYDKRNSIRAKAFAASQNNDQLNQPKRVIAFKLKNERPQNILKLILVDRATNQIVQYNDLSFDELNDVRRCVNDPNVYSKIKEHMKNSKVSEESQIFLNSLVQEML